MRAHARDGVDTTTTTIIIVVRCICGVDDPLQMSGLCKTRHLLLMATSLHWYGYFLREVAIPIFGKYWILMWRGFIEGSTVKYSIVTQRKDRVKGTQLSTVW